MAQAGLSRQALHAAVLGFVHPITGETLRFETALPPDMAALQASLAAL
jgi:23S rRNA pseudouridine1911/1915/1917 synthase